MSSPEPILASVAGIDKTPRLLSHAEVAGLTDWFGQWLAKTPVSKRQLSLRGLLKGALPTDSYTIYAIADGIPIVYDHANPDNPLNSVSRHLRFVIIALPDKALRAVFDIKQAILDRTLCIVGSANPDGETAFLQCASWDPKGLDRNLGLGIMRFYERTNGGWVYVGDSLNAVSHTASITLITLHPVNIVRFLSSIPFQLTKDLLMGKHYVVCFLFYAHVRTIISAILEVV